MLEIKQNSPDDFIQKMQYVLNKTKKISHAYLIETNSLSNSKELVFVFVKMLLCPQYMSESHEAETCKICHLIDQNNYSDFIVIEPEGSYIKKNQLLDLQQKFKTKSVVGGKRVYVIFQADKLNQTSSNTLLKFLEEPEEDIIAILVVPNRYQVIETILSRCQIFSLSRDNDSLNFENDKKMFDKIIDFLVCIYEYGPRTIAFENHLWYTSFKDKDTNRTALLQLKKIYMDLLECSHDIEYLFNKYGQAIEKILSKTSINDIIKKLKVIIEAEKKLTYNVNLKLWFDQFIIDLTKEV